MTTETSNRESRFTEADEFCPHPEYWTSLDSSSAEVEVGELVSALIRATQPDYVVETGTYKGRTAQLIGQALKKNGHGRLVSTEIVDFRVGIARNRCEGLPVTIHHMSSMDWTPEKVIDFLFIDSHFPLRAQEFYRYKPWLREHSIICFHDTAPRYSGVEAFTEELKDELETVQLHTPRGFNICQLKKKGEA